MEEFTLEKTVIETEKLRIAKRMQNLIQQPLDGLLYDLDLMPEQCKKTINTIRRLVIEELYKLKK